MFLQHACYPLRCRATNSFDGCDTWHLSAFSPFMTVSGRFLAVSSYARAACFSSPLRFRLPFAAALGCSHSFPQGNRAYTPYRGDLSDICASAPQWERRGAPAPRFRRAPHLDRWVLVWISDYAKVNAVSSPLGV